MILSKHPLRYRYVRLWSRRHARRLRSAPFAFCCLGGGVVVTVVSGRLVSVARY